MQFTATLILLILLLGRGLSSCLFGVELQGSWLSQAVLPSKESDGVEYASILIDAGHVSVWGRCHARLPGNNYVLEESASGSSCFRCFRLESRSPSVLSAVTTHLNTCYTRQTSAVASCPTSAELDFGKAVSLLLFRKDFTPVSCPVRGQFAIHYRSSYMEQNMKSDECDLDHKLRPSTMLSNCPTASVLSVNFAGPQCNFEKSFQLTCLAVWEARGDQSYVVLEQNDPKSPRFRCGLLRREPSKNGPVFSLSLSSDSTCESKLYSASLGHETFTLHPLPPRPFPAIVRSGTCKFPRWVQGEWSDVQVEGGSMLHEAAEKLVESVCLQRAEAHPNRFLVYSRTPCGEEYYSCVWFESRDVNVLEMQLALRPATIPSNDLCDNDKFLRRTWNTKAKTKPVMLSSCPIAGLYVGVIPDAPHLCSDIASDCTSPDVMSFFVYPCRNRTQILEKRVYRCLGAWEEDSRLFTYTRRLDLGFVMHECFVGSVDDDNSLVLMEAGGPDCTRGLDVLSLGMRLKERHKCPNIVANNQPWLIPEIRLENERNKQVFAVDGDHIRHFLDNVTNVQPMKGKADLMAVNKMLLLLCSLLTLSKVMR